MAKRFTFSFQSKVIFALLLFINVPFLVTGYMVKNLTRDLLLQEKEEKLLSLAQVLDKLLGEGGYDAILEQASAENATKEQKLRVLNKALEKITDDVSLSAPGLGAGYYSKELDVILTYGPSTESGHAVGLSIPPDHPGRIVMRENKPLVRSGTMVRGNIMNAMHPVSRNGTVIGYIWANELATDIETQMNAMYYRIFLVILLCFALTAGLLLWLSRRTVRDIDRLITGVKAMRSDLSKRIKVSAGELGAVASSINAMAEDIGKANEESSRAISILQSVMSNVDSTIFVRDLDTMELVYVNDALSDLMNRTSTTGCSEHEILPALTSPHQKSHFFDASGNPNFNAYQWEAHFESIGKHFLVTDRLITWHDGRLLHMQVGIDISERSALALAEAANLAQRDFLARMSHEIRTPMNGVLGMTHLAIQANPPPAQLEYLKKIQASASLLLGIINDILDFSRIEAGKMSIEKHIFNPRELVENIRELILPRISEKNLELVIDVDESVPEHVQGDRLRLSQILLNLLGNASKFTLKGFVSLKMRAEPLFPEKILLHCLVEDSGIGMTPEQQEALFKPFSQADSSTSREFGGTGLGLSISKALVELMGGTISAVSEAGKGSAFSFTVILENNGTDSLDGQQEAEGWEAMRCDHCALLLVEDNEINKEIAQAILEDLGASVDWAANGEEATQAFLQKDYDVILMDVRMPVMDGLEATKAIRASAKHDATTVPIIAMTANAMQEDREMSEKAGMNDHIAKPIDINELKKALYNQLQNRHDGKA